MLRAKDAPCEVLHRPTDPKYDESIRQFQGCPTIAISPKGRIFTAWYAGGTREPHMENFNLLCFSDDGGKTWEKNVVVIPSSIERCVHALDIQLWTAPNGDLYVFWVQNNTERAAESAARTAQPDQPLVTVDGFVFPDFVHAAWFMVCHEPNAEELVFTQPRYMDSGFLRCKPTVLENGRWLLFNYDQSSERYGYCVSDDAGATFQRRYGAKKLPTMFDEAMAYQRCDGSIRMLARTSVGCLAECSSYDNGETWTETEPSAFRDPSTRFYVSRTPSGRVLLVHNDDDAKRRRMTIALSDDDGATWPYQCVVDDRDNISYPDVDFYDGKVFLVYDRERTGAKEILFAVFTEADIIAGKPVTPRIISKPIPQEMEDQMLLEEAQQRLAVDSGKLYSTAEVMASLGITEDDLAKQGDVSIE